MTKVVTEIEGSMNREESFGFVQKYESCAQIDARGVTAVTTGWLFPREPAGNLKAAGNQARIKLKNQYIWQFLLSFSAVTTGLFRVILVKDQILFYLNPYIV